MTIYRDHLDGTIYRQALARAWDVPKGSGVLGDSLTDYRPEDTHQAGMRYYYDAIPGEYGQTPTGGFIVKADGELVGVFSSLKGRGDVLVIAAQNEGAQHLDCFDGYLTEFYAGHGFVEYDRQPNWTPGGPAVVYMALPEWLNKRAGLTNLAASIARCTGAVKATVIHDHVEYDDSGERTVVTDSVETYTRPHLMRDELPPYPFTVVGSAEYDAETNKLSALIGGNPWDKLPGTEPAIATAYSARLVELTKDSTTVRAALQRLSVNELKALQTAILAAQ